MERPDFEAVEKLLSGLAEDVGLGNWEINIKDYTEFETHSRGYVALDTDLAQLQVVAKADPQRWHVWVSKATKRGARPWWKGAKKIKHLHKVTQVALQVMDAIDEGRI